MTSGQWAQGRRTRSICRSWLCGDRCYLKSINHCWNSETTQYLRVEILVVLAPVREIGVCQDRFAVLSGVSEFSQILGALEFLVDPGAGACFAHILFVGAVVERDEGAEFGAAGLAAGLAC